MNNADTDATINASWQAERGKDLVTARLDKVTGGRNNMYLYETVSNVQNLLGVHEYIGHGKNRLGDRTSDHHKVYEGQINHSTWSKTTLQFRNDQLAKYTKYRKQEINK